MSWETPKTDWTVNPKAPEPTDFNRIEGNIDFLKGDIETKKGLIVDALGSIGVGADMSDTFADLAAAIGEIDRKKYAEGSLASPLSIRGLDFKPSIVIVRSYGYIFTYRSWYENSMSYSPLAQQSEYYYLYTIYDHQMPKFTPYVIYDINNKLMTIYDDGFDCTMPQIIGSEYDITGGGWFACE
jgi:hypothetical protein